MAIRLRTIGINQTKRRVALCAAETNPMVGDLYLNDADHEALAAKFAQDWQGQTVDWSYPDYWAAMETQKVRDAREEHDKWEASVSRVSDEEAANIDMALGNNPKPAAHIVRSRSTAILDHAWQDLRDGAWDDSNAHWERRVCAAVARFCECADDDEGTDIGRPWLDALTTLGLLSKAGRGRWQVTKQGEAIRERTLPALASDMRDRYLLSATVPEAQQVSPLPGANSSDHARALLADVFSQCVSGGAVEPQTQGQIADFLFPAEFPSRLCKNTCNCSSRPGVACDKCAGEQRP